MPSYQNVIMKSIILYKLIYANNWKGEIRIRK
jgi:hypothetical protein